MKGYENPLYAHFVDLKLTPRDAPTLAITPPAKNPVEPPLDFGHDHATTGVATRVPPAHGGVHGSRVPAPDADGIDQGGVRLVALTVPLGTHTGWNERAAAEAEVAAGFLLPEDVDRTVRENLGLYDRIMAKDPSDRGCGYLFGG